MRLRWLTSGAITLRHHVAFIAQFNPGAATRVRRRIKSAVLRLLEFPESGRIGQEAGTRELVLADLPYIIVYRISGNHVEVLRVFHPAMEGSGRMN